MTSTRFTSTLRTALSVIAICAVAAPPAALAGTQHRRSPENVRSAALSTPGIDRHNRWSPDARDAALGRYLGESTVGSQGPGAQHPRAAKDVRNGALTAPVLGWQDLRSPDARDAALGRYLGASTVGSQGQGAPAPSHTARSLPSYDGLDWPSAALGAAMFGGLVLAGYIAYIITRRVRTHATA